ncbi:cAMP-binding domain of CRP or a regulatory subunit of cAMP-dependent protein kinases [Gilliamella bombicola]|uniref:cAMP-binding domain of CRP or a regulatory subunit of cAMP-dependent protein kinases n=1 Tax=Gilliamella bombicola TaxID=1798182 RepID=A0A1C4AE71_9GAMM|nr:MULTISPECIES: Crp/Fnr family transcriptional regulator [Gilliamella]NUF27235.1 Crp/Fnr family transcriptional regulator [Gilliamella sp. ESL0254]SCB92873.1 cAMP-binding domain of CRP or a regulatory subunit of cAMP-dependent protein kinases [Gilliamella bombicola]
MQLKSLNKGRFSTYWKNNNNLIESVIKQCVVETKIVDEKSVLFRQGCKVNDLVLVYNGMISIRYEAANGRRFHLGTLDCDEHILGEMEFFTGYLCQFDIIAEEALTLSIVSADKLYQSLIEYPKLALFFATAIAFDYQDTLDIFLKRTLYSICYNIAFDLYQHYLNIHPVSSFQKNYLEAERFGTTDRVYRRAVSELVKLDIVEKNEGKLEIKSMEKLKEFIKCNDKISD